jgi:hypothetical protein
MNMLAQQLELPLKAFTAKDAKKSAKLTKRSFAVKPIIP